MDLHYDDNNASDLQLKLTELIRKKRDEMEVLQKLSDIIPGSVKNSTVTEHRIQETED